MVTLAVPSYILYKPNLMKHDNFTTVVLAFLREINIPLSNKTLADELKKHPDYYSLLAVHEVFDNWRIPNAAYQITFDELLESDLEDPFVAFVSNKYFLMVSKITSEYALVSNERWQKHRLPIDQFKNIFSGSILIAERDEMSGEEDYPAKRREEIINNMRVPAVIAGTATLLFGWLFLGSAFLSTLNLSVFLLVLFKTAGTAVAVLLLIQSIDGDNPLIQKLCGNDSNENCNAILSSKGAKINNYVSWSEVGFFYFAGSWLVLLFNSGDPQIVHLLALFNLIGLPYTFYSIFYQWKIARQWCILCCAVQGLLWLEFFAFLPALPMAFSGIGLKELAAFITGMAMPVLSWVVIKPYLLLYKQIDPLMQQLREHKYNKQVFTQILNEGAKYELPPEENAIIIGNREAENVITMVSNPFCQPCAKAHKALQWLQRRDDIKLQIIFSASGIENDPKTKVVTHLLSLQQSHDGITLKKALDDWYDQKYKNYDNWAKDYPVTNTSIDTATLKANNAWCKLADVTGTPTLFINGRKLPQNYQPDDIKYFI